MRFLKSGSLCIAWPNLHTHAITSLQSRKTWGLNFGIIKSTRTRWHGERLVANTKGFPSLVNFQRPKTCSCPFVRYFRTLFWDDITIIC